MGPRLKQMLLSSLRSVSSTTTANQVTFSFEKISPFPEERLQVELRTGYFLINENPQGSNSLRNIVEYRFYYQDYT